MLLRSLAHRADHFVVAGVADQDDVIALAGELDRLEMDLCHQRASRVDRLQMAGTGVGPDGRRDAVSAVQEQRPFGDLRNVLDEGHALAGEALDHVPVMDDLVVDVDVRPEHLDRLVEAIDGHIDARAKSAGTG